jgi:Bifunctional DNA primase/polymerase, N-terminal/Protein of unknown function (DUF3987)/Primase C terminal 2 (PriCT-2)
MAARRTSPGRSSPTIVAKNVGNAGATRQRVNRTFSGKTQAGKANGKGDTDTTTMADAVGLVATYGWKIFPARMEDGKKWSWLWAGHAPGQDENWGATNDVKQLEKNFNNKRYRTKCGIGVPTGADNGIIVIEGDTKKGHAKLKGKQDGLASIRELESKLGRLPDTLMAQSPTGSVHRYFKHPGEGYKIAKIAFAVGVDVKGDGGMVIAPPSVRAGVGAYHWLNDLPIAELPEAWRDVLATERTDTSSEQKNWAEQYGDEKDFFKRYGDSVNKSLDEFAAALAVVPNTVKTGRQHWIDIGHAIKYEYPGEEGKQLWLEFSKKWDGVFDGDERKYNTDEKAREKYLIKTWNGIKPDGRITGKSVYHHAYNADPNWHKAFKASTSPPASKGEWPTLAPEALYGLAGEVVRTIEPHSESDPVALLIQLLTYFGNAIGRSVYWQVEDTRHYTNLFTVLVGATSEGRKGTSADRIRRLLSNVEIDWVAECIHGGFSTGEGVIWMIRDPVIKRDSEGNETVTDPGVGDKRLLIDEREFSRVLTVAKRDGNTLTETLRRAWDGHEYIASITKNSPARVTKAHISVAGHITEAELKNMLDAVSMANGYANRFLILCVRRSKFLPFGGNLEQTAINALSDKIHAALMRVWLTEKEIPFNEEAAELWNQGGVYRELTKGKPGLLGAICGRGAPQVRRLAVIYATLDSCDQVKLVHLRAALALWRYCEDSARYIFGDALGDILADEVLHALRNSGELSRTHIRDLFKRNQSADKIGAALATLKKQGLARCEMRSTGGAGRKAECWIAL